MTTTDAAGSAGHGRETVGFGPLRITFDGRVLRPRPWTAAQSEWATEILATAPAGPVLELCAGAGQIGLLAVASTSRRLVCVDLDPVACGYARRNAEAAGLADRVEVREGPMDDVLRDSERFALVVADPPWVRSADVERYPDDPLVAIEGGADGLDVAHTCVDLARRHLVADGALLLQLGSVGQADRLRDQLAADGERAGDGEAELVVSELRWCERGVLVRLDLGESNR